MHAAGTGGGGCWEKVGEGLPEGPWDLSRTDALFLVDSVYSDTSEFSNLLPAARATSRGCAWTDGKGDGGGSPQGPAAKVSGLLEQPPCTGSRPVAGTAWSFWCPVRAPLWAGAWGDFSVSDFRWN